MNKISQYLLIAMLSVLLHSFAIAQGNQIDLSKKSKLLELYYSNAVISCGDSSTYWKKLFFDEFPDSFSELKQIYGYEDTDSLVLGYLYYDSYKHIGQLLKTLDNIIDEDIYFTKLIKVSINGYWQSDGISIFQHILEEKVTEKLELSCSVLSNFSEEEIVSFWYFFFDGPCPDQILPGEYEKVEFINKRIFLLMKAGLKKVNH